MRKITSVISVFLKNEAGAASACFLGLSAGALAFGFAVVTPIIARGDALTAMAVIEAVFARAGDVADLIFAHVGHRPPLL